MKKRKKKISFFLWHPGFKLKPCIYYTLFLPTELSSTKTSFTSTCNSTKFRPIIGSTCNAINHMSHSSSSFIFMRNLDVIISYILFFYIVYLDRRILWEKLCYDLFGTGLDFFWKWLGFDHMLARHELWSSISNDFFLGIFKCKWIIIFNQTKVLDMVGNMS